MFGDFGVMGRGPCRCVCPGTTATGCRFTAPPMTQPPNYIAGILLVHTTTLFSFSFSFSFSHSFSLRLTSYDLWFHSFMVSWFIIHGSWFIFRSRKSHYHDVGEVL